MALARCDVGSRAESRISSLRSCSGAESHVAIPWWSTAVLRGALPSTPGPVGRRPLQKTRELRTALRLRLAAPLAQLQFPTVHPDPGHRLRIQLTRIF